LPHFESVFFEANYDEVILPALWETQTWIDKSGSEIQSQLWNFQDKGGREVTLIPEATAIIKSMYESNWKNSLSKPIKLFYVTKCYRYERPQEGRYREFTQFGLEILGLKPESHAEEAQMLLRRCLDTVGVTYEYDDDAVRGLSYYTRTGFEAMCTVLGAQEQIAGVGMYAQGCGWAIGVDRLILAKTKQLLQYIVDTENKT
jgi:histidyl-tRNA synthetase